MLALKEYLSSGKFIDSADPRIITQAHSIAKHCSNDLVTVERLFLFVRDKILYDAGETSLCKASSVLVLGRGNSLGKSCLLAALCRVVNIPAGIQFQQVCDAKHMYLGQSHREPNIKWHSITAVLLNDVFIRLDSAMDRWLAWGRRCDVPSFDGTHDALLPEVDWQQQPNYKILSDDRHHVFADVPEFIDLKKMS